MSQGIVHGRIVIGITMSRSPASNCCLQLASRDHVAPHLDTIDLDNGNAGAVPPLELHVSVDVAHHKFNGNIGAHTRRDDNRGRA